MGYNLPKKLMKQHEKMAMALKAAKSAAGVGNVFKSSHLPRDSIKTLLSGGWALEIYGGWYALVQPSSKPGDTIPFFSNYWEFIAKYLKERLADEYVLSPIASLAIQTERFAIPVQIGVHTLKTTQSTIQLPHGASVAIYHDPKVLLDRRF